MRIVLPPSTRTEIAEEATNLRFPATIFESLPYSNQPGSYKYGSYMYEPYLQRETFKYVHSRRRRFNKLRPYDLRYKINRCEVCVEPMPDCQRSWTSDKKQQVFRLTGQLATVIYKTSNEDYWHNKKYRESKYKQAQEIQKKILNPFYEPINEWALATWEVVFGRIKKILDHDSAKNRRFFNILSEPTANELRKEMLAESQLEEKYIFTPDRMDNNDPNDDERNNEIEGDGKSLAEKMFADVIEEIKRVDLEDDEYDMEDTEDEIWPLGDSSEDDD